MKICYLAHAGMIHTERWVRYFADKGHEIHLISPEPFEGDNIENVELYLLRRVRPRIRIVSALIDILCHIVQTRKLVRKIKPDILHAHYISDCGILAALSGFHPLVLSAWGSDVLVDPKASNISNIMVKFALKKADLTLTTSQYLKGYLHREFKLPDNSVMAFHWGTDLRIFHKGCETEVRELRSKLGVDDSNFVTLSPRHLRDHYGIAYIVHAMPYIVAKYPGVILILLRGAAKDSGYESRIDKLAKELGVAQNVRLLYQELKPEEMAAYYNMSDVLISIPKTDQFAACIVEGMACGVIPIVGNLEVYREYLTDGENAFFVDRENPEDIAEKVIHCIEHPELKEGFYAINRKIIEEKLDWNKNAPHMEKLYLSYRR